MADHGTPARARQHHRQDGPGWTCPPCREALRIDHWRAREASRILRQRHPGEYLRILTQLGDNG